ncbi:retinoblastoma-related protein-like [Pyrus ussuriensis x Pyrus communis]|uniref:Retinoblastoma-related protein-like n=1 Tax=Pyrus ussuriensis x Pyrus communis TaxID=2448454 RepID=A0A5N5I9H6_9ROSA|nr:retinoblastoma-related protein-like [Pyrus ussuriensis x Pyrus communis]
MGVRFGERKEREEQGDGLEFANGGRDLQGLHFCGFIGSDYRRYLSLDDNSYKQVANLFKETKDLLISNASAIGKGTANEKTEFIVICGLTVKMYFRPFLRSGRITPPNWTSTYANFRAYRKAMFSIWGTKNQICYLRLQ